MNKVFFAGCFDPFTNGHLDVVKQALNRFDRVIIGLGVNEKKTRLFDRDKMIAAIKTTLKTENLQDKVLCISYDHYTGEKAIAMNCVCLIRGIKNKDEFEYEKFLFRYNMDNYNLNTIFFLPSKPELEIVSSTYARELFEAGDFESLKKIVPPAVYASLNPRRP